MLPTILPEVAEIVLVPAATPVARPAAVMVATPVLEEAHVTCPVMFFVLPSEYVPVALNCCVAPVKIVGSAGVTAIDVSVAVCTVRTVLPVIPLKVAEIVLVPAATPVARPAAVMVETPVFEEVHVTWPVMFCVVLSVKVPVAVNCCVVPAGIAGLAGVTVIEARVAAATVMLNALVAVCAEPEESVTCAVKLETPIAVGVPEMTPVPLFSDSPAGSEPPDIDHV